MCVYIYIYIYIYICVCVCVCVALQTLNVMAMNTYNMTAYLGKQLLNAASNIRSTSVTVLLPTKKEKGAGTHYSWIIIFFRHLNCFVTYTTEK